MNTKIAKFMIPLVAASALALAGCAGQGQKQTGGTLVGAAAGGLLGSQFGSGTGKLVGTALGVLAGAWIGNEVGTSLDNADKAAMRQSSQYALEATKTGHTSNWTNPDSGNSGTVTPTKTYQTAEGEYCREYQQTVTVAGKTQEAYGKACRQPDGSWKVRN
jgi:surface antigen